MSDNIRTALYGADYSVRLANRVIGRRPGPGARCRQALRERRHRRARRLPARRRRPGRPARRARHRRILLVARQQLQLPRPSRRSSPCATATARVIVRGETEEDLLRRDVGVHPRMIEYRNLRVALLGAGSVGAAGRRACCSSTATNSRSRVGAGLELVGHRGARPRRTAHASICRMTCSRPTPIAHPRRRHRDRADRRPRAGPRVPAAGDQLRRRRDHRQQGAARHPRPRAVRRGRAGRRAALLRGGRRRRDPDHPSAARQPRR